MLFPNLVISQNLPGGELPLRYNSSFAGVTGSPRIHTNAKYIFANSDRDNARAYGFDASYDNFFPSIRSGIGLSVYQSILTRDSNGSFGGVSATIISAAIAPKISIKGKYTISPSLDLSYRSLKSLYDGRGDFSYDGISARFGFLFNTNKYYIGYTAVLFESKYGGYKNNFYLYRSTIQFGYTFQKNEDSKLAFTPQFFIPISSFLRPDYNLGFRYNSFLIGILKLNNQYFIPDGFQIGYQKKGWRILLDNHFFRDNNYYSGKLKLRYMFNQKNGYKMF